MHAGHAAEGLIDPTDSWGTLGAHVVAARGSPGAREVIVVSWKDNQQPDIPDLTRRFSSAHDVTLASTFEPRGCILFLTLYYITGRRLGCRQTAPKSVQREETSHTSHITHKQYISRCSTSVSAAIEAGALARDTRAVLHSPLHSRFSRPLPLLLHSRLHASSVESHSLSH